MSETRRVERWTVTAGEGGRLDLYLAACFEEFSRAQLQSLIKAGEVQVDGLAVKPKHRLEGGEQITLHVPDAVKREVLAQDLPLQILHEEESLIVLNKAPGMVVHPASGTPDGTVVNALLHHCKGALAQVEQEERPGIVHRLDKDTSGCLIVAKEAEALQSLVEQFANRETSKLYLAVVERPLLKERDTVFTHIGRHPVHRQKMAVVDPGSGKTAITDYYTLYKDHDNTALVLCVIHTGRTHQIRVHLKHSGAAILGDPVYANCARQVTPVPRLLLHAWRLRVNHPTTGQPLQFEAPIPPEFERWTAPVAEVLETVREETFSYLTPR